MKDIIIDGHNDTMMHLIDEKTWLPIGHIGEKNDLHIDLHKLEKGGLNAPIFAAFTEGYYNEGAKSLSRSLAFLNCLQYSERENQENFQIVKRLVDIKNIIKEGKIAGISAIEGAYFFQEDNYYELIRQFSDLGVKILGFNWNYSNNLGEGVAEEYEKNGEKSQGGITELGIKVLREMKKLGIGIDISHMNEETFWGVAKNVHNPIIATHSNAYSLTPHRRNLTDKQLIEIGKTGGIVAAVLCPTFLTGEKEAYLEDYFNHIDYMVDLIGVEHVGIGSDFDGADLPVDMKDASEMGKIKVGLQQRGYSSDHISKILGENFLRVLWELENNSDKMDSHSMNMQIEMDIDRKLKVKLEEKGNIRVILDGKESIYKRDILELEYSLEFENSEIFHILTVEVENGENKIDRKTDIINIS